ncbi:MAG: hypothetical protein RLY20_1250 [Verrucomicrobiota bacterium]
MSNFFNDRFVSRRGFLGRTLAGAATATALGAIAADKAKEPNPFAYDVSRFTVTDPKLIRYEQKRVFAAPQRLPKAIALAANGNLLIGAGKFVSEIKPDGSLVSEIRTNEDVRCLAAGEDLIYVGSRERIEVFSAKGERKGAWDKPADKTYFTSLAVGANDVFAADAGQRLVLRYDRSGKMVSRLGERNKERNVPGFIVPSPFFAARLAKDGLLRITNPGRHRVEVYTADGYFEQSWGKPGAAIEHFCGCCNPTNLTLLSDGRVVTFEKGIPRVKVYAADGAFESVVAGAESFAENAKVCGPNDCTLGGLDGVSDADGRIYILDFVAANIRVMERKA